MHLLLSIQQASAGVLALSGQEPCSLCLSLEIFNREEIACGAIQASVQLLGQLLFWREPQMSQVIQTMISDQQQPTWP